MAARVFINVSGDRGIRTPDLRDANAALSQLSYIPGNLIVARADNLCQVIENQQVRPKPMDRPSGAKLVRL